MLDRRKFLQSAAATRAPAAAADALVAVSAASTSAEDAPAMTKERQQAMTPDEALAALKAGNERLVSGKTRTNRSSVLRDLVDNNGQLAIVGAMYDIATGRVSFLG